MKGVSIVKWDCAPLMNWRQSSPSACIRMQLFPSSGTIVLQPYFYSRHIPDGVAGGFIISFEDFVTRLRQKIVNDVEVILGVTTCTCSHEASSRLTLYAGHQIATAS